MTPPSPGAADDVAEDAIPPHLFAQIERGQCVAFVGAGFSAPAGLPSWTKLLQLLAESEGLPAALREHVTAIVSRRRPTAHELDQAAQLLSDALGDAFTERLRALLETPRPLPERMLLRSKWLQGIPFRAILTTNFDGLLRGSVPTRKHFRKALRQGEQHWWRERFWNGPAPAVLKLHGDLLSPPGQEGLVFTREGYRRLLYRDSAYREFLRSLFSTSTLLFLGFSFEDAYLNELRSEVLALLGHEEDEQPIAYAIMNDVPPVLREHFRRHEGLHILSYDSERPAEFQGFDQLLKAIHARTSAHGHFARVLAGKRILWMDPNPRNNSYGFLFFSEALEVGPGPRLPLVLAHTPEEALEQLRRGAFDLVISHWGGPADDSAPGARLLAGMRREDLRAPVLVFASRYEADERKRLALSLGAQGYCFAFETLFQRIEELLTRGEETG